jgi:hypothetical protein
MRREDRERWRKEREAARLRVLEARRMVAQWRREADERYAKDVTDGKIVPYQNSEDGKVVDIRSLRLRAYLRARRASRGE